MTDMPQRLKHRLARLVPRTGRQRVLVAVLLLLAVGWFLVPQLFVPMIRAKLQGMISGHLDARLHIGRLMYVAPFGVRARDVRLVSSADSNSPGTELLKVRRLDLKLARSPFRRGPLVIQNITIHDPEVHLIRTAEGRLVGIHGLARKDSPGDRSSTRPATPSAATTQPGDDDDADDDTDGLDIDSPGEAEREAARAKVSDMFRLRHFGLKGGRIVYEDRSRPGLPPVVWKDLDLGMQTRPRSHSAYGYTLDAAHSRLASLKSSGSFDLDRLQFTVGSLQLEARTQYTDEQSPLPAQIQRVLRDYRVEGRVLLDADGHFDARALQSSTFRATVELRDASGYAPQWDATLDRLAVRLSVDNHAVAAPGAPAAGPPAASTAASAAPVRGPLRIRIDSCEAASGDSTARLDKGELVLDRDANAWSVADVSGHIELGSEAGTLPETSRPVLAGMDARGEVRFTLAASGKLHPQSGEYRLVPEDLVVLAYPRGVRFQPRKSPAPLQDLGGGGSIRKDKGTRVVVFQDLTFAYGGDRATLASARLQLPARLPDLRRHARIEEISGTVDFRRPGPRYPGKFGNVIESLRPVGRFAVGRDSWLAMTRIEPDPRARTDPAAPPRSPPRRKNDWYFSVATDRGSFTLTDDRIPLTNMTGDATVSNMLVDVRRIEADVLGGKISGAVRVTPGPNLKYHGRAYLRGIDLDAVSRLYILPETKDAKLTGEGNLDIAFAGMRPKDGGSPLDTFRASGEFEVLGGDFWTIPVLGEIAIRAGGGREMTVGEAAGLFEVRSREIRLRNAAVSSPALGVQGSGAITLDKRLDLNVVAAPLGDWRDKLKQTRVPVLSDAAGEVAGAVQGLLNDATRGLLYEFRITGTTARPNLATVPVPAVTDTAAALFGQMLGGKQDRLLDSVKAGRAQQARPAREIRQ